MRNAGWAVLLTLIATVDAVGQTTADGEIAGRITDSQAAALPGVRITISSSDEQREAITDSDGRFALGMLKRGTYRVAADLAGFVSESGAITLSPRTRRAHLAWSLEVGCIEEGIRVILGAREAAALVDAIAHVRVESDNGLLLWSGRPECAGSVVQSFTVEVLNAVVRRSGQDDGRTTLQVLMSLHGTRLKPGGEYVGLFWPGWRAGDGLVFPIESGLISSPPGEVLSGMRVEEALGALGEWSRQRPR